MSSRKVKSRGHFSRWFGGDRIKIYQYIDKIQDDCFYVAKSIGMPLSKFKKEYQAFTDKRHKINKNHLLATLFFGSPLEARKKLSRGYTFRLKVLHEALNPFLIKDNT